MRLHRKTIAGLAEAMNVTHKRVRQVRANGVEGVCFVADWTEAIGAPDNDATSIAPAS